jgi:hypothetical protein
MTRHQILLPSQISLASMEDTAQPMDGTLPRAANSPPVSTDSNMCYMGISGSRMVLPEPIWTALSFLSTPQMSQTDAATAARPTSPRLTSIDVTETRT